MDVCMQFFFCFTQWSEVFSALFVTVTVTVTVAQKTGFSVNYMIETVTKNSSEVQNHARNNILTVRLYFVMRATMMMNNSRPYNV